MRILGSVRIETKTFPQPVFVPDSSSQARLYLCRNKLSNYTNNPALSTTPVPTETTNISGLIKNLPCS